MYRFRPVNCLLDKFNELENQEIYFASPEELNDPMEGYRDIFWKGDEIVWTNFFKNYIKSVEYIFSLTVVFGSTRQIEDNDLLTIFNPPVFGRLNIDELSKDIISTIFSHKVISQLPKKLSQKKQRVRQDELKSYLRLIHPIIVNVVSEKYHERGLISKLLFYQKLDSEYISSLEKGINNIPRLIDTFIKDGKEIEYSDIFFSSTMSVDNELQLINRSKLSEGKLNSNWFFLISEMPSKYVSKLEALLYPEWYAASFIEECNNSAVWGHYGDNHRGVCLKFKTKEQDGRLWLNLDQEAGYRKQDFRKKFEPLPFNKIEYSNEYTEIDFFRSLGRHAVMTLEYMWYKDENGMLSSLGNHLNRQDNDWHEKYWANFLKCNITKLKEWEYEKEYRLIISNWFHDYSTKHMRKLKYDFNDLEAIIFGIKTEIADKIRILKIIERKCKEHNRKDFEIHQAYYSRLSGKIETHKLNLIKFN